MGAADTTLTLKKEDKKVMISVSGWINLNVDRC